LTTIFVCDTCRYSVDEKTREDGKTGGEILAEAIEAAAPDTLTIKRQSCLMGCERHCNVAISAPGKLSYVLGKFEPSSTSAEAIIEYARQHSESETGTVPYRQWPEGVKGHFTARLPPLES